MGKLIGGCGLFGIALFMLLGFVKMTPNDSTLATLLTFGLAVVLPAIGGAALIRSHLRQRQTVVQGKNRLRQQTLESEILQLATRKGGKLTLVEVVGELAIDAETAKQSLDALAVQGFARTELTDSGVIVYSFYDIQNLGDKSSSKGVLDV